MGFNPRLFNNIFYPQQQEEEEQPSYGGFTPGARTQSQFRQMFDSPNYITKVAPEDRYTGAYTPKPSDEFSRRFGMMAQEEGPAQTAYKQFLQTQPDRESHAPGKMDRFAAIMAGVTQGLKDPTQGVKMAEYFKNRKYNEALDEFKLRGAGMKERAEEERQGMTSKRTIMNDIYKQMLDEKKGKSEQDLRDAQIRNYDSQVTDRGKAKASDFLEMDGPNGKSYYDPSSGQTITAGMPGLTPYQKEQIRIAEINAKANKLRADKYQPGGDSDRAGYEYYTDPSDEVAAGKAAVENVILANPKWAKFRGMDPKGGAEDGWFSSAQDDPEFAQFTAAVAADKRRALNAGQRTRRRPEGFMDMETILGGLPD